MQLESINIGAAKSIRHGNKVLTTGICKLGQTGATFVDEAGLRGDTIVDLEAHGGVDQAVYAYSAEDYDWWCEQSEHDFAAGMFGENLTIRGMPSDMNIGDRLLIGELVLEATSPRIPCSTLTTRLQDTTFGMAFRKAERPGIYFRVLNAGEVRAGDAVTYVANDASQVTVLDLFRFYYATHHDAVTLRRYLDEPVAIRFREKIAMKLAAIE